VRVRNQGQVGDCSPGNVRVPDLLRHCKRHQHDLRAWQQHVNSTWAANEQLNSRHRATTDITYENFGYMLQSYHFAYRKRWSTCSVNKTLVVRCSTWTENKQTLEIAVPFDAKSYRLDASYDTMLQEECFQTLKAISHRQGWKAALNMLKRSVKMQASRTCLKPQTKLRGCLQDTLRKF